MKSRLFHIGLILVLGLIFLSTYAQNAYSQNRVNILEADQIIGGTVEGKRVQKILGNVHLQSEDFEMFCDSAYQFVNESEIRAYGNIQINTEDEKIWTDSLTYFTDVDFSQLRGRVIIEADSTTLFGNSVDYRFSTKVAHFIDQIRLEDKDGILKADSGFYYREPDSATFRGEVQLSDTTQYIEGDSLFSNRSTDYYELYGDIYANDKENNTLLKGNYLEADSTGRRYLKGNAWLRNVKTDTVRTDSSVADTLSPKPSADTTLARSDSLTALPDSIRFTQREPEIKSDTTHIRSKEILLLKQQTQPDTTTIINAYQDVRIWSNKFSSVSDTAKYNDALEMFELWSNPKAWHNNIQLTGPYIKVILEDGDIHQLISYTDVFVAQEDTVLNRINQLKGDTLNTYFTDGEISRMRLNGNTHILRFTKDEAGDPDGALDSTAPTSIFYFENGELVEFRHLGAIEGDFLPESQSLSNRKLDGYSWNPKQRPTRPEEKMEPRFPPIPDERPFELPRRYQAHIQTKNN
ncbi:MAG: OstA-like protein [Balneolaceae bacterium]|nr:OstA-like protein [Balneolaceae bacterium]